jgi:phage terminase large subunit-like protein
MASYGEIAVDYARRVADGEILACKWVKLACRRHLADLELVRQPDFPYCFDEESARVACEFIENLPHVKGKWARGGEFMKLQPWQVWILASIFGWLRKRDGRRRFREAYLEVPRKNGKSFLSAGIGLYMFAMDGEHGSEVYSGATTEKQAWEVFRPARQMCDVTPELREFAGIEVWSKQLTIGRDGSRFEPIIGKPGDGASPHCAIADEFHEHETPDQVDTMKTGMGAREQPLLLLITTAGTNLAGPCYDAHLNARKVLEGGLQNEQQFCVMYGIDQEDDWTNPDVLRKANPNFGVSVDDEFLLAEQRQAVFNPMHQNRFKTKHLNVWCSARTAWMPLQAWHLCQEQGLQLDEFRGSQGWFVLDLASKDDIACFGQLFKRRMNGQDHYWWFARYYVPESALTSQDNPNAASYRKWHAQGFLSVTDGDEIDFDVIKDDVLDYRKRFQAKEVVYDPWRATQLAQQLAKDGASTVEMRQTVMNLSTPMKEVLSAVKACRLHHDGNPVTTWMISNVTAKVDAKDNVYPRKEKPQYKIDGAVALIMAMARGMIVPAAGIEAWLENPIMVET